jgi:dTDP-4-dehydrorhamnose 3,5-epimerase
VIFNKTTVEGAFVIALEPRGDERGFFARAFCRREFEEHGLNAEVVQCNLSLSPNAGTLRGMHFQRPPHEEAKLVRCTRGALWDVVLDLRPESRSYLSWYGVELNADNRRGLYIPEGCAHGFQTLAPNTEAFYQVSAAYAPDHEGGVRWDDRAFGLEWPEAATRTISEKDRGWPDYEPVQVSA